MYGGLMERMEPGRREAWLGRRAGQRHDPVAQLERGQSCGVISAGQPALPAPCDTGGSLFAVGRSSHTGWLCICMAHTHTDRNVPRFTSWGKNGGVWEKLKMSGEVDQAPVPKVVSHL